jgi:16S rRNA U516 pseudouridylate synthase RsuA-like enzyme
LNEGKNREIRKIFAAKSVRIRTIHRVRIGTVALAGLDSGCFRSLTKREVSWFLQRHTRHRID